MLMTFLFTFSVIGVGWGLYDEIATQRRIRRMARDCKPGGKKA